MTPDTQPKNMDVKAEVTVKSFKMCGISNALDGTEDDALFEEGDTSDDRNSSDKDILVFDDDNSEKDFYCFESD
ncbi:hypothetical protein X975_07639, partial [Stegodyphus mimosarum]